jgi:hypothetical protein
MRVFPSLYSWLFVALSFHYRPAPTDRVLYILCSWVHKQVQGTDGPVLRLDLAGGRRRCVSWERKKISGQERKWKGPPVCAMHPSLYMGLTLFPPLPKIKGGRRRRRIGLQKKITLFLILWRRRKPFLRMSRLFPMDLVRALLYFLY